MIFSKIKSQIEEKLPFVVYQKPNLTQIIGFFSNDADIHTWDSTKNGFLFHPFKEGETIFFEEEKCEILRENRSNIEVLENEMFEKSLINKDNFVKLVDSGINNINQDKFQKVVLSSFDLVPKKEIELEDIFLRLINKYETAFCYWFYHPKIGMWMGAAPELLVKKEKKHIKTVSLAGTQLFSENLVWKNKEITEQNIVTNYIQLVLNKYCKTVNLKDLKTTKAGKLAHLISEIEGELNSNNTIVELIKDLHPTPAICGLPKENALEFILKNENYPRTYYSGFLGEWNKNFENLEEDQVLLYVNLRCMEILEEFFKIYVGCGVTKDSIPENEFQEIVNKTRTMRNVI